VPMHRKNKGKTQTKKSAHSKALIPNGIQTMTLKVGKRPRPDHRLPAEHDMDGSTSLSMSETGDDSSATQFDDAGDIPDPSQDEMMEDVFKDNMELMLEIILKIREDPQFAKSIYADCPRLQHMLDVNPQLRPVFEDPRLVKVSFEKTYRDAGGYLPEDKKPFLVRLVNHPLFKFLKFIVFLKKVMGLLQGGGIAYIKDWIGNLFSLDSAPTPGGDGVDGGGDNMDGDADDGNAESREQRDSLNEAAEHFEEPEMKEKLDQLKTIEDPERLAEEIENDPDLRALRDSNDLCAELMSDPDTVKIITEPDNLRSLGECPDLFHADIADPEWNPGGDSTPDVGGADAVENYDGGMAAADGIEMDVDQDFEEGEDGAEEEEEEEESVVADVAADDDGFQGEGNLEEASEMEHHADEGERHIEDAEVEEEGEGGGEEEDEEGMEFEMGEEEVENKNSASDAARGKKGAAKKNPKSRAQQRKAQGNNFITNIGVGLTDMVAGEVVGVTAGELTGGSELDALGDMEDYGGGMMDDDLDGLEAAVDNTADAMDNAADAAEASDLMATAAETAELLTEDDVCDNIDNMNEHLEGVEEVVEEKQDEKKAAAGAATGGGAIAASNGKEGEEKGKSRSIESGDAKEEEHKKKSKFQFFGNFVGSVMTQAKEQIATNILGDDFGEQLVEKLEEGDEESGSGSDDSSRSSADSDHSSHSDIETGGKPSDDKGDGNDKTNRRGNDRKIDGYGEP